MEELGNENKKKINTPKSLEYVAVMQSSSNDIHVVAFMGTTNFSTNTKT